VPDTKPGSMSGHRKAVIGMLAAGIAAAAVSLSATMLPPAASAKAGPRIPASAVARLAAIARTVASQNGDAKPTSTLAVTTTQAKALRAAAPGTTIPIGANKPVYLIFMKGSFTANVPTPPGTGRPTGTYLSIMLNPATFQLLELGLSHRAPPVSLRTFGPVSTLAK
jgi:hypothetical protein